MRIKLIILPIFIVSTLIFSQVLIGIKGNFATLQESNGFVELRSLDQLGATFVISERSNRAYFIYNKKITIIEKDGTVSVDFLDVYPESAVYTKDKVMMNIDLFSKIMGTEKYETPNGQIALLDSVCILTSVNLSSNELRLTFLGFPFTEMMKVSTQKSKISVQLAPCLSIFLQRMI